MSRNGSGVYSLPAGNPVVTGTTISSSWANTTLSDIATALTGSVAADGQTAMTGNLQMGNNKVTGLANGSSSTDAAAYGQLTGGTVPASFTTLTLSSTLTLNGGTANQVLYLNGSKAVSGDADMTFDGTTLTLANGASIQGLTVGRGAGALAGNTALGTSALAGANSGNGYNTAIGYQAGYTNTTGGYNVFVGRLAGYANNADNNVAIGSSSLSANTTGTNNSALGFGSLNGNTTGSSNTGIGQYALQANTTASNNTAVGYQAGYSNTTGNVNLFIGNVAGYSNTTGLANTFMGGDSTGYYTTTGAYNTGIGNQALANNTTASQNTAVGYQAGYTNTTGDYNVFLGFRAGYTSNASTGSYGNTCIGNYAGYGLTTGVNNTFVGGFSASGTIAAGSSVTTGSKNTILGAYSGNNGGLDIRTASNYIVLSDGDGNPRMWQGGSKWFSTMIASGAGTNAMKYNTSTGEVTYDTSSARYKDNIRDSVYGLDAVMQIRSAQFEYKDDGRSDVGLIAEELQPIIPELVGVNKEGLADSVSYDRLVSVCIKAIQELKAEVDSLKAQINNGV